nr:hypothetical protein Iba_scaffold12587CG0010 [Ipomoea batatas]
MLRLHVVTESSVPPTSPLPCTAGRKTGMKLAVALLRCALVGLHPCRCYMMKIGGKGSCVAHGRGLRRYSSDSSPLMGWEPVAAAALFRRQIFVVVRLLLAGQSHYAKLRRRRGNKSSSLPPAATTTNPSLKMEKRGNGKVEACHGRRCCRGDPPAFLLGDAVQRNQGRRKALLRKRCCHVALSVSDREREIDEKERKVFGCRTSPFLPYLEATKHI